MHIKRVWFLALVSLLIVLSACQQEDLENLVQTSKEKIQSTINTDDKNNNNNDDNNENNNDENNQHPLTAPDAPIQKGDQSNDVETLQQIFQAIDYPVEASGTYDDLTTWAITDIQLQKDLPVSGVYDDDTKKVIAELLENEKTMSVGEGIERPEHPNEYPETVENPYDILALVNKNHALPGEYEPDDLVIPDVRFPYEEDDPKRYLRKVAADALEELIAAGDHADVEIYAQSGFRSYDRQESIFASNVEKNGEEHANTYSARPGESEHQTGLVMDVTSQSAGFDLNTDFGETEEGKWIKDHAHEYGFIIRYPEDKEDITKYQYEPWHLRYVGEKAATEIYENNESLEEYLDTE